MTVWEYRRLAKALNQRMRRMEDSGNLDEDYQLLQDSLAMVMPPKKNFVPYRLPESGERLSKGNKADKEVYANLQNLVEVYGGSLLTDKGKIQKMQTIVKQAEKRVSFLGISGTHLNIGTYKRLLKEVSGGVPAKKRVEFEFLWNKISGKQPSAITATTHTLEETARRFRMYLDRLARVSNYSDEAMRALSFEIAADALNGLFDRYGMVYDSEQIIDVLITAHMKDKNDIEDKSTVGSMINDWLNLDEKSRLKYVGFSDFYDKNRQKYT